MKLDLVRNSGILRRLYSNSAYFPTILGRKGVGDTNETYELFIIKFSIKFLGFIIVDPQGR